MNIFASMLLWPIVYGIGLLVTPLPRRLELWIGPLLGKFYFYADPKRRRIGEENMRRCLPDWTPEKRAKLLAENYSHYGILFLELAHLFSPIPGHFRRYARKIGRIEGVENWRRAHERGKGVLFVSSHLTNWEISAAMGAANGMPLTIATRFLKPQWLLKKMERSRLEAGYKCAYHPEALPTILRVLKKGECCVFVLDQYAPPPMGIPVNFFGAKVDTLAAIGTLAQRYGSGVIPVSQFRDEKGIIHIKVLPELNIDDLKRDPVRITQALVSEIEDHIRANPSQWLWIHRRFKNAVWPEPVRH